MRKSINLRSALAFGLIFAFLLNSFGPLPAAQAQDFALPTPGVRVNLSPEFNPPILKGIKVHPDNPFHFDFILDQGSSPSLLEGQNSIVIASEAKQSQQEQLKQEANKLIKYFLASLTIPEKDLWVNLSPYEKDRIIPNSFGLTEMGRDLLAEDYMLKQITASLIYPEDEIGKKFWKRIYEEAAEKFGTTNIPVNTFNKVWILPEKAVVYENAKAGTAYVVESKLKVMLEQDYLSLQKHALALHSVSLNDTSSIGANIVREIVIPQLTKEVNEGKNFSQLRQVYNSLILATWYKKKIKDSILEQVYADKNKIAGVNIDDPQEKERIYERYLQAFKKGVFNYIKEEAVPVSGMPGKEQGIFPRKYFSGGFTAMRMDLAMQSTTQAPTGNAEGLLNLQVDLAMSTTPNRVKPDAAMTSIVITRLVMLATLAILIKLNLNPQEDIYQYRMMLNELNFYGATDRYLTETDFEKYLKLIEEWFDSKRKGWKSLATAFYKVLTPVQIRSLEQRREESDLIKGILLYKRLNEKILDPMGILSGPRVAEILKNQNIAKRSKYLYLMMLNKALYLHAMGMSWEQQDFERDNNLLNGWYGNLKEPQQEELARSLARILSTEQIEFLRNRRPQTAFTRRLIEEVDRAMTGIREQAGVVIKDALKDDPWTLSAFEKGYNNPMIKDEAIGWIAHFIHVQGIRKMIRQLRWGDRKNITGLIEEFYNAYLLENEGYKIMAFQILLKRPEGGDITDIDILVKKDNRFIFVEVKQEQAMGRSARNVTFMKYILEPRNGKNKFDRLKDFLEFVRTENPDLQAIVNSQLARQLGQPLTDELTTQLREGGEVPLIFGLTFNVRAPILVTANLVETGRQRMPIQQVVSKNSKSIFNRNSFNRINYLKNTALKLIEMGKGYGFKVNAVYRPRRDLAMAAKNAELSQGPSLGWRATNNSRWIQTTIAHLFDFADFKLKNTMGPEERERSQRIVEDFLTGKIGIISAFQQLAPENQIEPRPSEEELWLISAWVGARHNAGIVGIKVLIPLLGPKRSPYPNDEVLLNDIRIMLVRRSIEYSMRIKGENSRKEGAGILDILERQLSFVGDNAMSGQDATLKERIDALLLQTDQDHVYQKLQEKISGNVEGQPLSSRPDRAMLNETIMVVKVFGFLYRYWSKNTLKGNIHRLKLRRSVQSGAFKEAADFLIQQPDSPDLFALFLKSLNSASTPLQARKLMEVFHSKFGKRATTHVIQRLSDILEEERPSLWDIVPMVALLNMAEDADANKVLAAVLKKIDDRHSVPAFILRALSREALQEMGGSYLAQDIMDRDRDFWHRVGKINDWKEDPFQVYYQYTELRKENDAAMMGTWEQEAREMRTSAFQTLKEGIDALLLQTDQDHVYQKLQEKINGSNIQEAVWIMEILSHREDRLRFLRIFEWGVKNDQPRFLRLTSVQVAGKVNDSRANKVLLAAAQDSFTRVAKMALEFLSRTGTEEDIPELLRIEGSLEEMTTYQIYDEHGAIVAYTKAVTEKNITTAGLTFQRSERMPNFIKKKIHDVIDVIKNRSIQERKSKKIELSAIKDRLLKDFLAWLKERNLEDIVVIGGGVRDALVGNQTADFDISVAVPLTQQEYFQVLPVTAQANERIDRYIRDRLGVLAEALGVSVDDFYNPNKKITWNRHEIQYPGPIRLTDEAGNFVYLKRALVDRNSLGVFSSSAVPSLLNMAIDANGQLYGSVVAIDDLKQKMVRIIGDPRHLNIGIILRIVRLEYELGQRLTFDDELSIRDWVRVYMKNGVEKVDLNYREALERQLRSIAKTNHGSTSPLIGLQQLGMVEVLHDRFGIELNNFFDPAMTQDRTRGGIDLTPANMNLKTRHNGGEIKFHIDPAQLEQLQNAPGFVPVIINIQPLESLSGFLGLNQPLVRTR